MNNKPKNYFFEKKDLLTVIDTTVETIQINMVPMLDNLIKTTTGGDKLTNHIAFKSLGLKDDAEFFVKIKKIVNEYADNAPLLKTKLNMVINDTVSTNTSDLNILLLLPIVGIGSYYTTTLLTVLNYVIDSILLNKDVVDSADRKGYMNINAKIVALVQNIPSLEKTDLKGIIGSVGAIPTLDASKNVLEVPKQVMNNFIATSIGSKVNGVVNSISDLISWNTNQNDTVDFVGNPIYHIRLLLIDLDAYRLDRLVSERKLLELKVMELKEAETGEKDPKLEKQIAYYSNKLEKVDGKIEKLLKG